MDAGFQVGGVVACCFSCNYSLACHLGHDLRENASQWALRAGTVPLQLSGLTEGVLDEHQPVLKQLCTAVSGP